jgi:hypothetical protein
MARRQYNVALQQGHETVPEGLADYIGPSSWPVTALKGKRRWILPCQHSAIKFEHPNIAGRKLEMFEFKHYRYNGGKFWTSHPGIDLTLLVNENEDGSGGGDFVAYFRLDEGKWLLVSWHPANYPALHLSVILKTEAELAKFIQEEFDGWKVRRCNISGVSIVEDRVGIQAAADE